MKIIYSFFILLFVGCVGTIDEANRAEQNIPTVAQANFAFAGVERAQFVSNTRLAAFFTPAVGGSGNFQYLLRDETGRIIASSDTDEVGVTSDGQLFLTARSLSPGAIFFVQVNAVDLGDNIEDSNRERIAVDLPSGEFPVFDGVSACRNFPGAGGATQIILDWDPGRISLDLFQQPLPDSTASYRIYYCREEFGTECLFDENTPNRTVVNVPEPRLDEFTVANLISGRDYLFRVTAVSAGSAAADIEPLEEQNVEFVSCRTEGSGPGTITFDGITSVVIRDGEAGVNEVDVTWAQAEGGFEGYMLLYHPIANENGIFNPADANLRTRIFTNPLELETSVNALDSFSFHAFTVRACPDFANDPNCNQGNDGGGQFIVRRTQPDVAVFGGIAGIRNNPTNPTQVFLDYEPADFSFGGIFDEYRLIVFRDEQEFDISQTSPTNTLGDVFPSAPADIHSLHVVNFDSNNPVSTTALVGGLEAGLVYRVDIQAFVDRTASLPISGGNIDVEFSGNGTVPVNISNNDTTPPLITQVVINPNAGLLTESDILEFIITFSEQAFVIGNPTIDLNIGGATRPMAFISGSGTNELRFSYTVTSPDNDLDGIGLDGPSILLNGGSIRDLSGNDAIVDLASQNLNLTAILIDTIPPGAPTNIQISDVWVQNTASPNITWNNPTVDFSFAEVGIGSTPTSANVAAFVPSNANSSHSFTGLSLVECSVNYHAVVRSVDNAGLRSTVAASVDTFRFDPTPPLAPSGISLNGVSTVLTEAPPVTWGLSTDACSFERYEYAIGFDDDSDGFDNGDANNTLDWFIVPTGAGTTYQAVDGVDGIGLNLLPGRDYRISIRGVDSAGNISAITSSPDWQIDLLGPDPITGLSVDTIWVNGNLPVNSPLISWVNPSNSDYRNTEISLGSNISIPSGTTDVVAPINVGGIAGQPASFTFSNLNTLTECTRYHPTAIAFDDIGNASPPANGISIFFSWDNTGPTATGSIDNSPVNGVELTTTVTRAPQTLLATLNESDNCFSTLSYEIGIGNTAGADDVQSFIAFTNTGNFQLESGVDGANFTLDFGETYFTSVRVTDEAGNSTIFTTPSWITPPPVGPENLAIAAEWVNGNFPVNSPLITWTNPTFASFGRTEIQLGSPIGTDNIAPAFNVGGSSGAPGSHVFTNLNGLTECTDIFPTLFSFTAGNSASQASNDAGISFAYDNTAPTASGSLQNSTVNGAVLTPALTSSPELILGGLNESDNCANTTLSFEVGIGVVAGTDNIQSFIPFTNTGNYQVVNGVDGAIFTLQRGIDYFTSIRITDAAGNSAIFSSPVWNIPPQVDLITTTDIVNDDACQSGDIQIDYTINNQGPDNATGVEVNVNCPTGTVFSNSPNPNYNGTSAIWSVGNLSVAGTENLTINCTAASAGAQSNILAEITSANISSNEQETNTSNDGSNDTGVLRSSTRLLGTVQADTGVQSIINYTYNVPLGSNRVMVVMIGEDKRQEFAGVVQSITYGGQPLIFVAGEQARTGFSTRAEMWYLPESGIQAATNTSVIITLSGADGNPGTASQDLFSNVNTLAIENVNQANPIADFGSNSTNPTANSISLTLAANQCEFGIVGQEYGHPDNQNLSGPWTSLGTSTDAQGAYIAGIYLAQTAGNVTATASAGRAPFRRAIVGAFFRPLP